MPIGDRDYIRGKHPPNCTCTECTDKRLGKLRKEAHSSYISVCPRCGQKSLWHNVKEHKYECLNLKCKAVGSNPDEIARKSEFSGAYEQSAELDGVKHDSYKGGGVVNDNRKKSLSTLVPGKNNIKKIVAKVRTSKWLIALLFVFSFSICGWVISLFVGSFVPFWILFGFSSIYSIEKWLSYIIRKHKGIGKLYRLFLNLSILSLLGLIIWSGIKLFSRQFVHSPLTGSLIFFAEFILFIWMWRVIAKNGWRWPSMKLTVFSLICLFLIFAFAGVPPMSVYKDNLVTNWNTFLAEREDERKQAEAEQEKEMPEPYEVLQFKTFNDESTGLRMEYPEGWISNIIPTGDELSTRVNFEGTIGQSNMPCNLLIGYNVDFTDARGIWTSMVNLAASSLVSKCPITILGVPGYELTQEINGKNSRIFVSEWESGLLLAYRSYPTDALTSSEINTLNNCLEHLIVTASIAELKPNLPEPTPIKPIVPDIPKPESVLPEIEESDTRNPSWEELKAFLLKDDTDKMEYVFPTTVCEDFAKKLQKNAKEAGWRCAFVSVQLDGYPDWYNLGIPSYTGHACNAFETTDRGLVYIDCTSSASGSGPLHGDCIVDVQIGNDYLPKFIVPTEWKALNMGKIVDINISRW